MQKWLKKTLVWILTVEARLALKRYKPRVVAVTGSVGKTSAKDAIYAVLAGSTYVRKSQKSFNSEFGLPLTILGCPNGWNNPLRWLQNLFDGLLLLLRHTRYPEWLVLEVGADRPGDIKSVAAWLPVDIAVITRLPEMPVHVEFFSSPGQVVEEKLSLIPALKPEGVLVAYGDDERFAEMRARAAGRRVISFGLSEGAEVHAGDVRMLYEEGKEEFPVGMSAKLSAGGVSVPIEVPGTIGAHSLLPAIAAAAVGVALGKDIASVAEALRGYEPPQGRMHLLRGIKDTLIIDDTYNSSPAAVLAGLETLSTLKSGRKIAVLGDMLELGRHSAAEHRKVGAAAAACADMLVTVGFRARDIAEGALDAGMSETLILQYEDAHKAGEELAALIKPGDYLFIKGSQSMRMERTVEAVMAASQRAKELLVRQDAEWRKR